ETLVRWLDRRVGHEGFCEALQEVGWLTVELDRLVIPRFERHNGQSAKRRALTADRVARHRAQNAGNASSVTQALPEERSGEERREEEPPNPPSGGGGAAVGFDDFWQEYPKRVRRKEAKTAWEALCPSPELAGRILAAVREHARSAPWKKEDGRF